MATYQDDIIANYAELAEQRGWSAEQMAAHLEPLDPALAAEFRAQHVTEAKSAPKGRKTAAKSEA